MPDWLTKDAPKDFTVSVWASAPDGQSWKLRSYQAPGARLSICWVRVGTAVALLVPLSRNQPQLQPPVLAMFRLLHPAAVPLFGTNSPKLPLVTSSGPVGLKTLSNVGVTYTAWPVVDVAPMITGRPVRLESKTKRCCESYQTDFAPVVLEPTARITGTTPFVKSVVSRSNASRKTGLPFRSVFCLPYIWTPNSGTPFSWTRVWTGVPRASSTTLRTSIEDPFGQLAAQLLWRIGSNSAS